MRQASTKSKSRHKSLMCFTESFLKGLPPEQSRSESSVTLIKVSPRRILSSRLTTKSSIFKGRPTIILGEICVRESQTVLRISVLR